ncbi:hypothetical protein KUV50_01245 [Membranicola marinus]|uniref:Uncharacterized protein n=1 Tax=Membranihabitans marinus TaxID=1227546 RepID=A0A953L9K4_9BACT|nr:hypothetical protein [Membranihabitans marinus]MBY5956741.1 hypothetical protein [Membranihabitans marinus]
MFVKTFFASQTQVKHRFNFSSKENFILDENWIFEVGGKTKTKNQINSLPDSFVVADEAAFPVTTLPLWILGFLYR